MALEHLDLRGKADQLDELLARPVIIDAALSDAVSEIIASVRRNGDAALKELTERFDGVVVGEVALAPGEAAGALARIGGPLREALQVAHRRIVAHHERDEAPCGETITEGVRIVDLVRPLARAGCYVPGGLARYPSSVLMCATPAKVAGVGEVAVCVPPAPDGSVDDVTLAAAAIAGVDEIYRVGGAQAVAALAYGTESIKAVDIIAGPGNRYVTEAMRQVSGVVKVPSAMAGPSEVLVVADEHTPAALAAIDLAVQAEHGPDGLSWLVSWSEAKIQEIDRELDRIVASSPRRSALEATLKAGGYACLVQGPEEAIAVSNVVAPEHLELMVQGADELLALVDNAGAIFLGASTPAALGDYLAGPNHVLPTNRTARFSSVLSTRDFRRYMHAIQAGPGSLRALGPHVITLAFAEGLDAHARSVEMRL
ncbi:MAG: histidinol dehydrogenase [Acidimicrobiales bacterium]